MTDPGDGTRRLRVSILNPHGFNADNEKTGILQGRSLRRSLRFSIIWSTRNTDITDANWENSLRLVQGEYFDLDGNTMTELRPVLTKMR